MKILFISPEAVPFAKTGGLADVAGALPKALKKMGHDARLFMPRYKMVDPVKFNLQKINDELWEGKIPETDVIVYFYEQPDFFANRTQLYQEKGVDYPDNLERFSAFCQAALKMVKQLNWRPDVIHANDWQSALALAHLKVTYKNDPFFQRAAAIYSIHNVGYLGLFPKEKISATGFGWEQFTADKLEFWDNLALAKAGLVYADAINTVSPTYAKEIQTEEYGCGLDGLLRSRQADLYGIINGIDYDVWNPSTDKLLPRRYSPATISMKSDNKLALQKVNGLPPKKDTPVFGIITRLADQKGLDILAAALDTLLPMDVQLVVLGTGDPQYHKLLTEKKEQFPTKVGLNLKFDAMLAELIYAGADLFLMPSRYEPCGLGQLISFKYGTVPVVRKTGGLADTVHEFNLKSGEGEGFIFEDYSSAALLGAIQRALAIYRQPQVWQALQKKIMQLDYSWNSSAKEYVSLYMKAIRKVIGR